MQYEKSITENIHECIFVLKDQKYSIYRHLIYAD